jgi:hypothetical protein
VCVCVCVCVCVLFFPNFFKLFLTALVSHRVSFMLFLGALDVLLYSSLLPRCPGDCSALAVSICHSAHHCSSAASGLRSELSHHFCLRSKTEELETSLLGRPQTGQNVATISTHSNEEIFKLVQKFLLF